MKRRRINPPRRPDWNDSRAGTYFIIIVTHQRRHLFTNPDYRIIARYALTSLPNLPKFTGFSLDEWVIMPDHLHFILIKNTSEANDCSISTAVGTLKSLVAKRIHRIDPQTPARLWQRGYDDRIIPDKRAYHAVRAYIRDNPRKWRNRWG